MFGWSQAKGLFSVLSIFQVLITKQDVRNKYSLDNLRETVEELISMNCVPIINENDVVAPPPDIDLDLVGVRIYKLLYVIYISY